MRNFEVLKNYFLGKNPDLIETMADNSLKLIGIEGKHFVLRTELVQKLNELKDYVDEKDQELGEAINALLEALSTDIEALQEADRRMQGDIESLDLRTDTLEYWKNNNNFVMLEDLNTRLGNYYTKAQVDSLIAAIPTLTYEVVQVLPTTNISNRTIYLVPSQDPDDNNFYEEYLYVADITQPYDPDGWELIGTTKIDLSDYYTKSEVDSLIPTNTSDLTNDGDGLTNMYVNKYAKTNIPNGGLYLELGDRAYIVANNTLLNDRLLDERDLVSLEKIANKVTTISASSTHTQYPSAAATYTALSGKQDAITLTAGTNYYIDQMSEGIYIIPYNEVQATRIYDNSSRNNLIFNTIYFDPFGGMLSSSTYYGAVLVVTKTTSGSGMLPGSPTWQYNILSNNMLTYGNVTSSNYTKYTLSLIQVQKTTNLVTTINSSSTNDKYPSAKAVYDNLPKTFTGTDGQTAGTGGLVPAPATTDVDKYLKSDGTWAEAGGGTNISYGTTDLTPGVSELAEGEVYLCFE